MEHANPMATPLDPSVHIKPNPEPSEGNQSNLFAKILGELQYLANAIQSNISFSINRFTLYVANTSLAHYRMLKWILWYLAGMCTHGITYWNWGWQKSIIAYANAAHSNHDKCKSTTDIIFTLEGRVITWKSKKQTISALSTTEAEYIALSYGGVEVWWYHNLFTKLRFFQTDPITIESNSLGTIARATNPYLTHSSWYINLKWFMVH